MKLVVMRALALVLAIQGASAAPDFASLAKKLEAGDFKDRQAAISGIAALSDSDLGGVIRRLYTEKMGPEATARIPDILKQMFLRQCHHLGEPETGMSLRLYVKANSGTGISAVHPVIGNLAKDSPGAAAGLQTGDVIMAWDGKPLEGHDSLIRLLQMIRRAGPGAKVHLQVRRYEHDGPARLKGSGDLQEPVEMTLGAPLAEPPEKVNEKSYVGWLERMRIEHGLPEKLAVPQS